jgi:hypothetical protein
MGKRVFVRVVRDDVVGYFNARVGDRTAINIACQKEPVRFIRRVNFLFPPGTKAGVLLGENLGDKARGRARDGAGNTSAEQAPDSGTPAAQ